MALPRLRLGVYGRIAALLVLWTAATSLVQVGLGVTILGGREPPVGVGWTSMGDVLVRVAGAAAYALLAFAASRRAPLWSRPVRAGAVHLGGVAVLHGCAWLGAALLARSGGDAPFGPLFYLYRTLEYLVFAVFAHGLLYGEHAQAREREMLHLRAGVADSTAARLRARLRALRMDWSPRFLTGALESIASLLARDPAAARQMLVAVSAVLRRTLALLRVERVRLEREVELVEDVLRVEALRRPGLEVSWEVDGGALDAATPRMALLALVNGVLEDAPAAAPLRLRIAVAAEDEAAVLRVDVHGAWAASPGALVATDDGVRRSRLAPDAVRLELRLAEGAEPATGPGDEVPAAVRAGTPVPASSSSLPTPGGAPVGRLLESGTYAALVVLHAAVALVAAVEAAAEGRVALAAPVWVYAGGSAAYAALWWGSFAAAARRLTVRFPVRQAGWPRRVALHAAAALAVGLLNAVALFPFQWFAVQGGGVHIGLRTYWDWGNLAVYVPLAGIAHGFVHARAYQERRLAELRLRSELAESELRRTRAELQALKAELNPHFLFNALNTVASLAHSDVAAARRVVAHLSALLRRVLESASLQEVSVAEEVEFLRLYLEIERARFGDALRMTYRLEPAALRARVPHLLVQPLVENAVKHGLRPRGGTGEVTLSVARRGASLHLTVEDDGVGLEHESGAEGTGTGLAHVRQRLRQLYGDDHEFALAPAPGGGTRARIRIPFVEAVVAPAPGEAA